VDDGELNLKPTAKLAGLGVQYGVDGPVAEVPPGRHTRLNYNNVTRDENGERVRSRARGRHGLRALEPFGLGMLRTLCAVSFSLGSSPLRRFLLATPGSLEALPRPIPPFLFPPPPPRVRVPVFAHGYRGLGVGRPPRRRRDLRLPPRLELPRARSLLLHRRLRRLRLQLAALPPPAAVRRLRDVQPRRRGQLRARRAVRGQGRLRVHHHGEHFVEGAVQGSRGWGFFGILFSCSFSNSPSFGQIH
jgi:hypothetical protein